MVNDSTCADRRARWLAALGRRGSVVFGPLPGAGPYLKVLVESLVTAKWTAGAIEGAAPNARFETGADSQEWCGSADVIVVLRWQHDRLRQGGRGASDTRGSIEEYFGVGW